MKNLKKLRRPARILCLPLALIFALGATFAYFTDRVDAKGSIATSDNALDVDITPIVPPVEDPEDDDSDTDDDTDPDFPSDPGEDTIGEWWADINATALANYNPGDKLCLDGQIVNNGTLNLEYRETFIVTCSQAMNVQDPEFRLFLSCKRESYGALTGVDTIPFTYSADQKTFTYVIGPKDLASGKTLQANYDLVFNKTASNDYQGVTIDVLYILEACQDGADWTVIATDSITTTAAGAIPVVPAAPAG